MRNGIIFILALFCLLPKFVEATPVKRFVLCDTINKDTLYIMRVGEILVVGNKKKSRKYYRNTRRYWRTVRNIRKVYPYAQEANKTILEINEQLKHVKNKKQRRKIIRKKYKQLMKIYKKPLMRLKISQGKLLVKLIYRESGHSSYYHLRELKGSFTAIFWQSIARLFGSSLKSKYDPQGKDWMIEEILTRMRNGELAPPQKLKINVDTH